MLTFGTLSWFEEAQTRINEDDVFKRLGTNDVRFGVAVDDEVFSVTLEAFACTQVHTADDDDQRGLDFTIAMTAGDWQGYLSAKRRAHPQSLNSLDLARPGGIVSSATPRGRLLFTRYAASIERFFDVAALEIAH